MPLTMFELEQDRKTATIKTDSGSLTITYRPHELTPAKELAMLRASDSERDDDDPDAVNTARSNIKRQLDSFAALVEAWDFMGPLAKADDGTNLKVPRHLTDPLELAAWCEAEGGELMVNPGNMVPLEPKYLRLISSQFLMQVVNELNADMRPNAKRQRRSDDS